MAHLTGWTWSFFFFSSRGRHTRYIGDWSSDVCSSDLRSLSVRHDPTEGRKDGTTVGSCLTLRDLSVLPAFRPYRSEERRVGKGVDLGGRRIIEKRKLLNTEPRTKPRICSH